MPPAGADHGPGADWVVQRADRRAGEAAGASCWVTEATLSKPGTYVLRAIVHDGDLATVDDIMITVTR